MKKIVFITDAPHNPRMAKRQTTYLNMGFSVTVYAFTRSTPIVTTDIYHPIVVGDLSGLPYIKRLGCICRGIKSVLDKHKTEDVVYHLFNLQIAMFFRIFSNKPYIYEEADLTHTYIHSKIIRSLFELINRHVIRKARLSLFTSEGFVRYHFGEKRPANSYIVPNLLTPSVTEIPDVPKKRTFNANCIRFGFVGGVRFESTMKFIEHIVKNYPSHEFYLYGIIASKYESRVSALQQNVNFHNGGHFRNPNDLPEIYSNIDFVIATYDVSIHNVRYAEPNKLYEAVYFRTPIIVSSGTYLAERVRELGVGVDVDPLSGKEIDKLVESVTDEMYASMVEQINHIPRSFGIYDDKSLRDVLNLK